MIASRWLSADKLLFPAAVCLLGLGLLMVYSASFPMAQRQWNDGYRFVTRQAMWAGLGLGLIGVGMSVDYRDYRRPLVLGGSLATVLGALVLVLALPGNGMRRWIFVGPFSIQPSEAAKLVVVLFLASYLARKEDRINDLRHGLLPGFAVVGLITLLVAIEPDLGTAIVIVGIAGSMLWVAGLSYKLVAQAASVMVILGAIEVFRHPYQLRRLMTWLNPFEDPTGAGFQTIQSLIAVGSGGVTGVGLASSSQKLFFLPYPYTDFIFAVIAEELGLIGAAIVVLAFLIIFWRGLRTAVRAPDRFGFYLALGLTSMLVLQALVNMSIVVNLLPTTGIPLPLISYGGSSLLVCCAAIGILLNVSQHSHA